MSRPRKPMAECKTYRPTDAEHNTPHSVYRIFAADGMLLYIGCAVDVTARIYMHRTTWTMTDAFLIHRHYDHHTSEEYPTKALARAAERKAIATERPILNRQHNPSRWVRVAGQYVPADAETAETMTALNRLPEPSPDVVRLLDFFTNVPAAPTAGRREDPHLAGRGASSTPELRTPATP